MTELIQTNNDLCTGCNRCVRECPMETANITYQDSDGEIKVKIDHEKCIACGRCYSACKHKARYYNDDTARFFDDLANGIPISVIAAPSIRTNIPDWKSLFTYLKQHGVNKIYDVSLGADICIWAHIRHIEQDKAAPMITQPCPVIVSYCEKYKQELLHRLSPVHSPMACASIYMKEYEGITDRIAALSPCIAKADEFEVTGLSQYNITFTMLNEYIEKNNIKFPRKHTDFDHNESSLGAIFPMPGGLKENIEFYLGKKMSIDRGEGRKVFGKLDTYAESPAELLPQIFDVLNCSEGCNIGTACSRSHNIFKINRTMENRHNIAVGNHGKEYFDNLYKEYDIKFDLSKFMRVYEPAEILHPQIADEDIEKAFNLLDKTDDEKKNVDCGACGSDTCHSMARKIALGVNIPINCIIKAMEDAKKEHEHAEHVEWLLDTEERVRVMLDATPIGSCIWSKDGQLIDCNQEMVKLFDLSSKQEYMERFPELSPERQPDGRLSVDVIAKNNEATYEEGYQRYEWMGRTLTGDPRPVEVTLVRVSYKGDDFVAAYTRDLREQKQMMEELDANIEKAEAAARALELAQITTTAMFASNPQINILFNSNFKAVDCNPAAVNFMGFETKEETLAGFLDNLVHNMPVFQSDGRPSVSIAEKLVAAMKEGYAKFETEIIICGEMRNLDVEFIKIPYENGFGVVAYVIDMTVIHERELELTRTREENEMQLTKLDLVVRASKIGLWEMEVVQDDPVNLSNELIFSDEFRSMLGFTDETDFPNIVSSWSKRLHPDDRDRSLKAFADHLLDTTGQTPFDIEYRLKKKNSDYAYFHASGETIRDEAGNPIRVAGALVDVTETKNILLDTEKQKLEAEAANQAKSAFLSTMSHEIRTPMNAILGITEIQLQNASLEQSVRDGLEKIYTSGDMLLGIINDILDLSKIEAGKMELIPMHYETASLISDTAQLNMMRIGSKPIEFELHVNENLYANLHGDALRVKQILNNLLSNAFKYTKEGIVIMTITTEDIADSAEVMLVISVSDTGQGMSKEQVAKLFDEYSRFNQETNRSTEGTGLGMSITSNLIRLMNGKIVIESEPGKGSVFTVYLPQGKVDSEILGQEKAENLHKFRTNSRAQMKRLQVVRELMPYGSVLIVDDVETNIFVARGLMAPYELKIDSAESGFEAIEKVRKGGVYDIVFMDHMMPKMDGVETTKNLRKMGYTHPIVALTANAVAGQADVFLGNGFDDFISKPIDVRQLNSILNKLIRDKQPPEVLKAARKQAEAKKEKTSNGDSQPALDPQFIEIFVRDANKSLAVLDAFMEKGGSYSEEEIRTYVIHTHGMKSALANVRKMDLSAAALKLEQLGREKNLKSIAVETPAFLDSLRAFVSELTPKTEVAEEGAEEKLFLKEKLLEIKAACEEYDESTADGVLAELRKNAWSKQTGELLEKVAEQLLHSDFDDATEAIDKFVETL